MAITSTYATLDATRVYLSMGSQDVTDDAEIMRFIRNASRAIDRYTRRKFYPRVETRYYDYVKQKGVRLDDDLLSLSSLTTQNGASLVPNSVLILDTGLGNYNHPPYDSIVINSSAGSVLSFSGTKQKSQQVAGIWGYHEDYENAWMDTGTSLAASYSASGGSISLAGAGSTGTGASDISGNAPRISIGDLLKIGDEYFDAIGAGSVATIALVRPYANGTTAVSHAAGTSIAKFVYEPDIEYATRRLAVHTYAQRSTPFTVRSAFPALGEIQLGEDIPQDVKNRMVRFKRPRITGY